MEGSMYRSGDSRRERERERNDELIVPLKSPEQPVFSRLVLAGCMMCWFNKDLETIVYHTIDRIGGIIRNSVGGSEMGKVKEL